MATSGRTGSSMPLRSRIVAAVIAVGVFLFAFADVIANFYVDLAWFRDMDHLPVFWTRIWSEVIVGAVFGAATLLILWTNIMVARRMQAQTTTPAYPEGIPLNPRQEMELMLARVREAFAPWAGIIFTLLAIVLSFNIGAGMADQWESFRLAVAGPTFGATDPQFGLDIGFFVFRLPALRMVADWLSGALWLALAITLAVHVLEGGIRPTGRYRGFDPHVKAHVSVLAGLLVASQAFGYWLSIYELNFSPRGQVLGASYTDVHAQMPAYIALIAIALAVGVLLLLNIRYKGWRLPLIGLGIWVAAGILVGGVYPALVQQFVVSPNELAYEKPYIQRNIEATRAAFDLASIQATGFPAASDLSVKDITEATSTVRNVRLWDPNVVVNSYKQLQEIRFYYDFNDVDIDRYTVNGQRQQVLISAREMNVTQLSDNAKTWVNRHLVYTHGYGAVVSPVNAVSPDGLPQFYVRDLPPKSSSPELTITVPGIYFGEETGDYAIVRTEQSEFDYPVGGENATTSYEGENGVSLDSLGARLAFAINFGDPEILFSGAITDKSRILYRRTITERVKALAPWLLLDRDPYPIIVDGRMLWVLDGYTSSMYYPYSERDGASGVNYLRNSVKVTVDAYDGTTRMYAFDATDPVLKSYRALFPGLFEEASEIPAGVREHLRYPEDLFRIQAEVYKTYHMLNAPVFYNKEDQWALPGEATDNPMDPYYVLMQLPGETTDAFMLMEPFTPRSKDNMIGWMAAKCDPESYGQRVVYNFPKQSLVMGPQQIRARLNQEPDISKELTLLNQQGSQVIFGNLLVIPIRDAVVYIEPVYIQASQSPMPELKRVIVAYSDRVAMGPDLASALTAVFGEAPSEGEAPSDGETGTVTPPTGSANARELAQARRLYDRALEAQKKGDWSAYGDYIRQLGELLDKLASTPATSTK